MHLERGSKKSKMGSKHLVVERRIETMGELRKNTKESPGELRRLTITQTPLKAHQLMLVRKTHKKSETKRPTTQEVNVGN